ncbi:uncharacterized protein LOC119664087 [Teleopsis dalmanni]|uniref:uncharacterized protein LOC119664087 n=1 Tax=Teleopsis dalmanni TaxID=139649 RepID=UPI0018CE08FF|nr:uncharacterized protein LOC119664087 [Teleopsis dalmanni]XP_037929573.1 uncharacterized protein LOC119664087 [Teleopsis dalmanni]
MHLRSGGAHTHAVRTSNSRHAATPLDDVPLLIAAAPTHNTFVSYAVQHNRGTLTKKFLLWVVVLLQICFIGCFWLLQLGFNASISNNSLTTATKEYTAPNSNKNDNQQQTKGDVLLAAGRVNFIKSAALKLPKYKVQKTFNAAQKQLIEQQKPQHTLQRNKLYLNDNVNIFATDFVFKPNRLNRTGIGLIGENGGTILKQSIMSAEVMRTLVDKSKTSEGGVWCYREGSVNETNHNMDRVVGDSVEQEVDLMSLDWFENAQCKCQTSWHGKDCGQPEIIWRALMTAKKPFRLIEPSKQMAHRLVYMLEGNFFSLDLLELQIQAVIEVVDYFIIYFKNNKATLEQLRMLQRRLKNILKRGNYFLYHCKSDTTQREVTEVSCTAARAYAAFRKHLRVDTVSAFNLNETDLILYSSDYEIISRSALKFLKYYAKPEVEYIRFRLKYTVYGFYWQHAKQTHLTSLVSFFTHLDNPHLGNGDPIQLITKASMQNNSAFIIGDLNHFGGWFCKYCEQSDEIISAIQAEFSSLQVQFPNSTRNHHIDVTYIQKLIANGIYVDGKSQLLKMRRYSDKYFAPNYAEENSWKYGNLLVNLYETLDEDIEDENVY